MANIGLQEYANAIRLYEPFEPVMAENTSKETLTDEVLEILRNEKAGTQDIDIPDDQIAKRRLIRALLNIRQPLPLKKEMMQKLDALLHLEKEEKDTVSAAELPNAVADFPDTGIQCAESMALWQGNITDIKADAIVNAANEKLLGCMQPLHDCVDNAIHSAAGPMLRDDCAEIIHRQKSDEEIGTAKITRGYHLPSAYVIHTVGPAVTNETPLNDVHVAELISSYQSCLDLAHEIEDIRTIAFPAISTGVFGFPKQRAAEIAVTTVGNWLKQNDHHFDRIVFNVYSEADKAIYEDVFK
ncbi:protein-ADP-ribose hydrolase [Salinicoccus cyprini]|uniref:Protein-ADP-ribose hydrolase n=1 Tax=Salinicoccus cyprini TaxID=2493691 RepID=A0A558ATQ4_9STAP|nr:protein-ADP-ribose hydrolase [Salinicoccus cyprini]TVT27645.1 protein-ADP-ribose hydrolase [Salinicoccus cyprini]